MLYNDIILINYSIKKPVFVWYENIKLSLLNLIQTIPSYAEIYYKLCKGENRYEKNKTA